MLDLASLTAAFAYGLAGSLHCVAMCGPLTIVASTSTRRRAALPIVDAGAALQEVRQRPVLATVAYQIGRLLGYAAFGAVFGAVGGALDLGLSVTVSKLLPFLLVTLLVVQALDLRPLRWLPKVPMAKLARYRPKSELALAAFIGLVTVLIPCGFLYSTAPLAVATGSAFGGAALLSAFALGTMPALVATAVLGALPKLTPARARFARRFLSATAALLVVLRLATMEPPATAEASTQPAKHHCHDMGMDP